MLAYPDFYIDGAWQRPASTSAIDVRSAATEDVIGRVAAGTADDVDRAVRAARRACDTHWGHTTPGERADWLDRLAAGLKARQADVARTIAMEVGCPITMSTSVQAGLPIVVTQQFAELARTFVFEHEVGNSLIAREPWGVVGAITPWNYPLHQIMAKVAPALAAGCTVVLKPSEIAPLNACLLAEVCLEVGLPAGVLNIVHGTGPVVGEALVTHPAIDMVSFTGSLLAGRRIGALTGERIVKCTLELGGKSACVILDDAPFDKAVAHGVKNAMLNSGQTCSAWTRMLVPRARRDDAVALASATLQTLALGDPLDPATRLGPLVSARQRERVLGFIARGRAEGATLVAGGGAAEGFARGHYVAPTIFADVSPSSTVAQEEIFGPVLSILSYDTDDDAVAIANGTIYGLGGGVWSGDPGRALRVARRLRTGQVDINGGRFNARAPFGGYKMSGLGREFGTHGFEEFLQVKAMQR
ncbi:MAG: aldehyde dehydrogenase family protein [Acidobacteria bacterium]|nr:aldehyde dehydrogenase family protein [Acidobacteriota bacterium]